MDKLTKFKTGWASAAIGVLVGWSCCFAQSDRAPLNAGAFDNAIQKQKQVVAELTRILQLNEVMLSDGAVQLMLESLLADEEKQAEGIRALGKRTLGRKPDDLSDQDRTDRDRLADNQEIYTNRYRRLEKGMDIKGAARPDSVFVQLLEIAEEERLSQSLAEASERIRGNQLGNAMRLTNRIVAILRKMVSLIAQNTVLDEEGHDEQGGNAGFNVPSLRLKELNEMLLEFGWGGANVDPLGHILRALRRMEELTERQRKLADQTKARADRHDNAPKLAKEEWEIRYQALEVATQLVLLSPELDGLIRKAAGTIEEAIPPLEAGPLTEAVKPTRQAADELAAATAKLRAIWDNILARIKKYTQETEPIMGSGGGIPHGMSKEGAEKIRKMVMIMLRTTSLLTQAIERETALMDKTRQAPADTDLPTLKSEQAALIPFVTDEILPFNKLSQPLATNAHTREIMEKAGPATELLKDGIDRMERSAAALEKQDRPEALKRQQEATEVMTDALDLLVNILQRLLGQLAPSALTTGSGGSGGMALDPQGGALKAAGFLFRLPEEKRERVRQAFRDTFPRRYDDAIKTYYEAIAHE